MDSTLGTALSGLFGTIIALAVVLGLAWLTIKGLRHWQDRGLAPRAGEPDHPMPFTSTSMIRSRWPTAS